MNCNKSFSTIFTDRSDFLDGHLLFTDTNHDIVHFHCFVGQCDAELSVSAQTLHHLYSSGEECASSDDEQPES